MKHWPPSQISQLEKLWSNGMSIRKIAKEMQRTPGSIAGKIFKLNLQRRKQKITIIDGVPKTNIKCDGIKELKLERIQPQHSLQLADW